MIELSDVLFRYPDGEFELRILGLELVRGEQVGLIGPSGSGKTTLLHLVAGIERPERGRIAVDGTVMSELPDANRRAFRVRNLGLVFQEFALLEHLSVLDNVLLPYRITPALRLDGVARDRARSLIERVGLAEVPNRLVTHLSQGERQRVAVCRALV
ncbi:MAG: ABC transporter ATP-binding protein, partial [Myxococcota bacterium]